MLFPSMAREAQRLRVAEDERKRKEESEAFMLARSSINITEATPAPKLPSPRNHTPAQKQPSKPKLPAFVQKKRSPDGPPAAGNEAQPAAKHAKQTLPKPVPPASPALAPAPQAPRPSSEPPVQGSAQTIEAAPTSSATPVEKTVSLVGYDDSDEDED